MSARILDGKTLALQIQSEQATEVERFVAETGVRPKLAAVLVGDDPASAVYVRNKQKACERVGLLGTLERLPADTSTAGLLDVIGRLNADASVHGILVQLPVPKQIDSRAVLDAVTPLKDVDCFHPENVGLLVQGRPRFKPCTPHGVQQVLRRSGIDTAGQHVVIVGRSDIVGKPLANMLCQKSPDGNATVTICHSGTRDLTAITRSADILVAAIGQPEFLRAAHIRPGAVVIDVGINRIDRGLVGDVHFEEAAAVASAITPVPGGIGPLTVTMLLANTLTAARLSLG